MMMIIIIITTTTIVISITCLIKLRFVIITRIYRIFCGGLILSRILLYTLHIYPNVTTLFVPPFCRLWVRKIVQFNFNHQN